MARSFPGGANGDRILPASGYPTFTTSTGLTIGAWVYPLTGSGGALGRVVDFADTTTASGIYINESLPNGWSAQIPLSSGGNFTINTGANSVVFNGWTFLLLSWDGTSLGSTGLTLFYAYPGGKLTAASISVASAGGGGTVVSSSTLCIGNRAVDQARCFNGRIGQVFHASRVMSVSEAQEYMEKGVPGSRVGGYWPLWGFSPEPDLSGGRHNATVIGTTIAPGPPIGHYTPQRVILPISQQISCQVTFAAAPGVAVVGHETISRQATLPAGARVGGGTQPGTLGHTLIARSTASFGVRPAATVISHEVETPTTNFGVQAGAAFIGGGVKNEVVSLGLQAGLGVVRNPSVAYTVAAGATFDGQITAHPDVVAGIVFDGQVSAHPDVLAGIVFDGQISAHPDVVAGIRFDGQVPSHPDVVAGITFKAAFSHAFQLPIGFQTGVQVRSLLRTPFLVGVRSGVHVSVQQTGFDTLTPAAHVGLTATVISQTRVLAPVLRLAVTAGMPVLGQQAILIRPFGWYAQVGLRTDAARAMPARVTLGTATGAVEGGGIRYAWTRSEGILAGFQALVIAHVVHRSLPLGMAAQLLTIGHAAHAAMTMALAARFTPYGTTQPGVYGDLTHLGIGSGFSLPHTVDLMPEVVAFRDAVAMTFGAVKNALVEQFGLKAGPAITVAYQVLKQQIVHEAMAAGITVTMAHMIASEELAVAVRSGFGSVARVSTATSPLAASVKAAFLARARAVLPELLGLAAKPAFQLRVVTAARIDPPQEIAAGMALFPEVFRRGATSWAALAGMVTTSELDALAAVHQGMAAGIRLAVAEILHGVLPLGMHAGFITDLTSWTLGGILAAGIQAGYRTDSRVMPFYRPRQRRRRRTIVEVRNRPTSVETGS